MWRRPVLSRPARGGVIPEILASRAPEGNCLVKGASRRFAVSPLTRQFPSGRVPAWFSGCGLARGGPLYLTEKLQLLSSPLCAWIRSGHPAAMPTGATKRRRIRMAPLIHGHRRSVIIGRSPLFDIVAPRRKSQPKCACTWQSLPFDDRAGAPSRRRYRQLIQGVARLNDRMAGWQTCEIMTVPVSVARTRQLTFAPHLL